MACDRARAAHEQQREQQLRAAIISVVERCDTDGCGSLDRHQLKCAYAALMGCKPSKLQVNLLLTHRPGSGATASMPGADSTRISWQHFTDSMMVLMGSSRDPDEHIRQIFRSFDTEGCGYISRRCAQTAFKNAMPTIDSRVVDQVFDELDQDRDGRISAREFVAMMQQQLPTTSQ